MLSKFLNTKTLIIIFIVLGGIFLVTKLTQKEDRTFKSELVTIDTSKVTKMVIIPKVGSDGQQITFTRSGNDWELEAGGKRYMPDESSIENILVELTRMRTERVAAIDESKWNELEVTDSTASRIQLFEGKDVIADLYLGKFSYTQAPQTNPMQRQQTRMFTHVRPHDDKTVYVVEGFIKMNVQPNVNTYRAKTLCAVNKEDITRIDYSYPGNEKMTLESRDGKWYLNGEETDSTKTARYLMKFTRLTNNSYVEDEVPMSSNPSHVVTVEGNNTLPVELRAYPTSDTTHQYLVTSSLIPDARFSGYKSRLFEKVFVPREEFFADKNQE
jgi:hypothetical protein